MKNRITLRDSVDSEVRSAVDWAVIYPMRWQVWGAAWDAADKDSISEAFGGVEKTVLDTVGEMVEGLRT